MAKRRLFQFPLSYVTEDNWRHHMTAAFGQLDDRWHNGVDFGANVGEPVYPIFDGRIHSWGTDHPVYGNWVIVEHDPASFSYYYHLQHRSNYDTGEPVQKHHIIGHVGVSGQSTGPHKHLGVSGRPDFTGFVDPVAYILERYWYDDGYSEPIPPTPVEPAPEIPPAPEPEEPTVPEPEAPPVDERPLYPMPTVETSHVLAAAELASTLLPTRARSIVYIVYGLAGVALGATTTWLTATSQLAPEALIGATAVYGYLGAFVAVLAKANVPPAAQPEADE